jgi:undecaprenyl pyrophosphate phosphatase UppP
MTKERKMISILLRYPAHMFRAVMDPRVSPLRHLSKAQQFQVTVVLGLMWTTVFCLSFSAWFWYGELIVVHMLMASATLVTGVTFHTASQSNEESAQLVPAKVDRYSR